VTPWLKFGADLACQVEVEVEVEVEVRTTKKKRVCPKAFFILSIHN